ncbi:MAG: hypothetical protein OFPI_38080 [Osedax symbiont Rs2]|nr:MAG: hypothetical protein OFPI_38080 [Osedax symbiont Rs2]
MLPRYSDRCGFFDRQINLNTQGIDLAVPISELYHLRLTQ